MVATPTAPAAKAKRAEMEAMGKGGGDCLLIASWSSRLLELPWWVFQRSFIWSITEARSSFSSSRLLLLLVPPFPPPGPNKCMLPARTNQSGIGAPIPVSCSACSGLQPARLALLKGFTSYPCCCCTVVHSGVRKEHTAHGLLSRMEDRVGGEGEESGNKEK